MKRTPLKRGTKGLKRTPLRKTRTEPRPGRVDREGWEAINAELEERTRGACEAGERTVCTLRATDRHHVQRKSQGGADTAQNLLYCCHQCHMWIHAHPAEARMVGWLS